MININTISNPQKNFEVSTEGFVSFIKSIVKESMVEVINDRMYENVVLDWRDRSMLRSLQSKTTFSYILSLITSTIDSFTMDFMKDTNPSVDTSKFF